MINHGTRPTRIKHKDYDLLKSHRFAGVVQFADEYFADAGLTMPNQNETDTEYVPPTPPMPFGCTNFAQSELATDLTKQIHNPSDLEAVTHANANGGYDIRRSLDAARKLGWIKQYFNIRARGAIDYFDAFRLAYIAGVTAGENRSITWGTPWFASWEKAALQGESMMPMPTDAELQGLRSGTLNVAWHDSKLDGWKSIDGVLVQRDKSWQGTGIGDRGFLYFRREIINTVMSITGTVAFTGTNKEVPNPQTVDIGALQWVISALRGLLEKYIH